LAEFRHIFVQGSISRLPVVVDLLHLGNLLVGEHGFLFLLALVDDDLFDVLIPCAQIHEKHLIGPVAQLPSVHGSGVLIHVDDPKRHGNVRRVEHIPRQHNDCLHTVFLKNLAADGFLIAVCIQCAVGEKESSDAMRDVKF